MKKILKLAVLFALSMCVGSAFATTWFVRADGGPIYYTGLVGDSCDGKTDSAMVTSGGANQHCAVSEFRYLYDNGSWGNWAWIIAGGDTVVIRGCHAAGDQQNPSNPNCRVGYDTATGPGSRGWCAGTGPNYSCSTPNVPSGTALAHTRILGACAYGTYTCTPVTRANLLPYSGNLTQIFGGFGVGQVIALAGSQYVDLEGLEITAHNSGCSSWGAPPYPKSCSASSPSDDYAGQGIVTTPTTSHLLLQDVYIHGFGSSGIYGPTGAGTVLTRVALLFNGFAGWNMDQGGASNGPNATLTQSYLTMIGNGCQEEYPIVHSQFPAMACYDSPHGGFGDSWSGQTCDTADPNCSFLSFTCDHCWIAYNTKDGAMGPHVPLTTLSLTNSFWAGNLGAQGKWTNGPSGTFLFENNIVIANCERLEYLMPGAAHTFSIASGIPGAQLGNCRGNDMFTFSAVPNSTAHVRNNTFVFVRATDTFGNQEVAFDLSCVTLNACGTAQLDFTNNIFYGFPSVGTNPALFYQDSSETSLVHTVKNNVEYRMRAGETCGVNGVICSDPLLQNSPSASLPASNMDVFTPGNSSGAYPSTDSPVLNAGATYSGQPTTDYYGAARPSPISIGAVEFGGGSPTVATPTGAPVAGGYTGTQSVTLSTVTPSAVICYTITGATPTATVAGTCDGAPTQTYSTAISVAATTTIKAIGTLAGYLNSGTFSGTYTITAPVAATPTCTPAGGIYTSARTVTCSSTTPSSTTRCTTNGSTPTGASPVCTAISVASSLTLKAFSQAAGYTDSAVRTEVYTINIPTPGGTTASGNTIMKGTVTIP